MVRRGAGGIASLLTLPRELWEALESDLMGMGWTLADIPERLSWRGVWAFLMRCPESSATYRARAKWGEEQEKSQATDVIEAAQAMGW